MPFRERGQPLFIARAVPICGVAICAVLAAATSGLATPITFSASQGDLAASTTFDSFGDDLIVTLTNVSPCDVMIPVDVLTAVFFNVNAPELFSLTRVSAVLGPGSSVLFGKTDPGGVVGGEWGYANNLSGAPGNAHYGISSTGLGLFGPHDRFPGTNLQGPASLNGLEYGITSAGDNPATGNKPVKGKNALIRNQVVFTLSGLPDGFDPATQITNVHWQYGTDLSEPSIPEPATLCLLALGCLALRKRPRR